MSTSLRGLAASVAFSRGRRVLLPLIYYTSARVVPAAMSLLFTIVCAQTLSSAQYGMYTLVSLPALIVAGFAAGLAGQPMLRFATALSHRATKRGLYLVPAVASLPLVPLLLGYLVHLGRPLSLALISLALVPLNALVDTRRNYFIALSCIKEVFFLDSIRTIVGLAVLAALIAAGIRESAAPLVALVCGGAAAVAVFSVRFDRPNDRGSLPVDRAYLMYGVWLAFWLAANATFPYLERYLLESNFSLSVAGTYSILADPLFAVSSASNLIMISAFMPLYVAAWNNGRAGEVRRLTMLASACIVVVSGGVFGAGWIIARANIGKYGSILRASPALGIALLGASAIWQLSIFLHKPFELRAQTRHMLMCLALALCTFLAAAHPAIRAWGAPGMAIARGFAGLVYAVAVLMLNRRARAG